MKIPNIYITWLIAGERQLKHVQFVNKIEC